MTFFIDFEGPPWTEPAKKYFPHNPGVPVIPPLPPTIPRSPHAPVAQCGECGRLIPQVDMYSCANARCPVQPKVWC